MPEQAMDEEKEEADPEPVAAEPVYNTFNRVAKQYESMAESEETKRANIRIFIGMKSEIFLSFRL